MIPKSSSYSQKNNIYKTEPLYHCKHRASPGDIVYRANSVSSTALKEEKFYLVLSLTEEYEGFGSHVDDQGLTETCDYFIWYGFLLDTTGKIVIEQIQFLRKLT